MFEYLHNILVLFRKEALMILKDKRSRIILVMPILAQTMLFGYVVTYDLNKIEYALLDEDHSYASRELARRFEASPVFFHMATLRNSSEIAEVLDNKKAILVLHIGPQFERQLNSGQTVPVQVLVDGRNSNVAGTASGYATSMIEAFTNARLQERGYAASAITISSRAWFNPNLETRWNIISGLLAVLAVIQVTVLAGQSVAREKEQGTFDQLLVTPFGPLTIMFGKALPPVLVGLAQSTIVLFIALNWFKIPFAGSLAILYLALIIFNFAIVGIGLCVSALTSTMQQAMLYSFTLLMPMILLSGFATPITSMPEAFQLATQINPVRYGVELAQRIYLEGAGITEISHLFWPLGVMAIVTLGMASRLFRTRLG
ncbi:ABC-2 type transporter [uncultured delta proteobacterium]|uniref:Transport permease protein n=1 Tax=uncultured delta proteobacterium TaxID=34034 RepID=A0A212JNT6_9DELT|nr:ABC-2 type transporter [uncultured delta proteobacterium]